jgi:hypothetical protein
MSPIEIIAWIFLAIGVVSFGIVLTDICMGRYQHTPIMNIAWPITALYSGPIALFMYFKYSRAHKMNMKTQRLAKKVKKKPYWVEVFLSSIHSGAGCSLANIIAEIAICWIGIYILGHMIWSSFFIDFIFALAVGLIFQYYLIKPMKPRLTPSEAFGLAVKADILSISSFQIGVLGWLLAVHFIFNEQLGAGQVLYWFMMQVALTIGLLITYPVNAALLQSRIKHPII